MRKLLRVDLMAFCCVFLIATADAQERPRTVQPSVTSPPSFPSPEATPPVASSDADVVRVDTALVTVPVSVMDRQGRFVSDLKSEDFRIYEDGAEQEIAYFATVDEPFTVVLMLDTSSSVWKKLDRIKDAATAFVNQLRPTDRVMVVSFAHRMTIHCEPTSDKEQLRRTIRYIGKGILWGVSLVQLTIGWMPLDVLRSIAVNR